MNIRRRKTKTIRVGSVSIGGAHPIAVQSMVKTKTSDLAKTLLQIRDLEACGCELVRVAVKDIEDAQAIQQIKKQTKIPLIADIHFQWQLALKAIESGADKIRLNPGNIGNKKDIRSIVCAAKNARIPIRIGINSGSLRPGSRKKGIAGKMVQSALGYIRLLEDLGFYNIILSLKASNILDTVQAYRTISRSCVYPLHLGLTATGPSFYGIIKSSIALGDLLLDGIGDTIRVSLTDSPDQEVRAAKAILETLNIRRFSHQIISCPTCGRCEVNLVKLVNELDKKLSAVTTARPLKVAVMGCVVNGPGEAKEADIGVAFGRKEGLLFKKGKPVRKIAFLSCCEEIIKEVTGSP